MSKQEKKVTILKMWKEKDFYDSKQQDEKEIKWIIEPDTPFYLLISVVENSFIVGGIIDKITTNADSWFVPFSGQQKEWYDYTLVEHLIRILQKLDVKHAIANISTCGNYRLEIVGWKDASKTRDIDLIPFLTHECKYKDDWSLTQINSHGNKSFISWEYIHLKTRSLKTRYYGDSVFSKCVRQIVVLDAIDKHYERFFDHGMINTKLLMDINGELWEDSIKIYPGNHQR